jgi:hypothetical protein
MKSWGIRILLLYLGFVALIVTMVSMSMNQKIDLVAKDYYAREIAYQSKLDKMNRSRALTRPVSWKLEKDMLQVQFPAEVKMPVSGMLFLYCPADANSDFKTTFNSVMNEAVIDISGARAGRYELQLDWQSGSETYFDEGVINLP